MRYDWIMLDADNTLFDYDRAEAVALEEALIAASLPPGQDILETYQRINADIWHEFEQGLITQESLKTERYQRLFDEMGIGADPQAFSALYLDRLARASFLLPEAEHVVRALRTRARLLLITNGLADVQRPRLAASPIADCFDGVVVSEEVGASKPDREIFDVAFAIMGHPARETVLLVGDSLTSDMRGGCDYGIHTCWFNPQAQPRTLDLPIRYEIRQLAELLDILGLEQRHAPSGS